jgi:hypothetical protein
MILQFPWIVFCFIFYWPGIATPYMSITLMVVFFPTAVGLVFGCYSAYVEGTALRNILILVCLILAFVLLVFLFFALTRSHFTLYPMLVFPETISVSSTLLLFR